MKKHIRKILLLVIAVPFLLTSCQKSELTDRDNMNSAAENQFKNGLDYCGTPLTAPMVNYAQSVAPATVTVMNDATNLLVRIELTEPGWYINLPALFIGTAEELSALPGVTVDFNGPNTVYFNSTSPPFGLPIGPGWITGGNSWEYTMPLSSLPDCFVVVAYVRIRNYDNGSFLDIWGKSPSKTSGYYLNYCKQVCESCETAYAYGESYATCFLNIQGVQSNNWGWTNGPLSEGTYEWPIWAAAGQCNLDNGTHVGTLHVIYSEGTATVQYNMFEGFGLSTTHLHVGSDILPINKKGKFITAPGQFGNIHNNLGGASDDEFVINGLSGPIYIAAHADVCGYYE